MAYTPTTNITESSGGVIKTEIKDGTASLGTITTTIKKDDTTGATRVISMQTTFGFFGYDGSSSAATDKANILAIAQAIASHFYNQGGSEDSVYEWVTNNL